MMHYNRNPRAAAARFLARITLIAMAVNSAEEKGRSHFAFFDGANWWAASKSGVLDGPYDNESAAQLRADMEDGEVVR